MERVIVIGCSGAGKSTFSAKLAEKTGLPLVHLDQLLWRENWQSVDQEEFDRLHAQAINQPRWIIDGNYGRTLPMRVERCDTLIYMDLPRRVCLWGVIRRVLRNYGKTRPDMGPGCPERFDWEFMKFVWSFRKKYRKKQMALVEQVKDRVHVEVFTSHKQAERYLQQM